MKLSILFAALAAAFLSPLAWHESPGAVRLWLGLASAVLALLYVIAQWPDTRVGRWLRSPGPAPAATRVLLAPHRWGAWLFLFIKLKLQSERHLDEVAPGLLLGRRPLSADRTPADCVVDLCVEFPPSGPVVGVPDDDYLSLPALDGTAPALADLQHAVGWIQQRLARGRRVLVHCAAGHGRSATVMACVLIARGLAADADSAERLMQSARPLVSLNRTQRWIVARYVEARTDEPLQDPENAR